MSFYDCLQNNIDHTYTLAAMIEAKQYSPYSLAVMFSYDCQQSNILVVAQ